MESILDQRIAYYKEIVLNMLKNIDFIDYSQYEKPRDILAELVLVRKMYEDVYNKGKIRGLSKNAQLD